ncbi:MAG: RDD family protein [Bacillus sp. (in: firmicutes)]
MKYGGFWIRFGASLIDGIILTIPITILFFAILMPATAEVTWYEDADGFLTAADEDMVGLFGVMMIWYLLSALISLLYYVLTQSSKMQATLGKKLCGLIVVGPTGERITFLRSLGRYFSMFLSSLIMNIGFIMAAFTDRKRALHDMVANTYVVYKDSVDHTSKSSTDTTPPQPSGTVY